MSKTQRKFCRRHHFSDGQCTHFYVLRGCRLAGRTMEHANNVNAFKSAIIQILTLIVSNRWRQQQILPERK